MFVVASGLAIMFVMNAFAKGTQRLSILESGVISHLQDGPDVPDSYASAAVTVNQTLIILSSGWQLETTDLIPHWTRQYTKTTDYVDSTYGITFWLGKHWYVLKGRGSDGSIYRLDTSQSMPVWEKVLPSFPHGVEQAACVVMHGQEGDEVLVSGGLQHTYRILYYNDVYRWRGPGYDWHLHSQISSYRYGHSMTTDGERIFIASGMGHSADLTVLMYHQGHHGWMFLSPLPDLGSFRKNGCSAVWGNTLLLVGGGGPMLVLNINNGNWSSPQISGQDISHRDYHCPVALITP